ncbi:MAG TPA: sigma-70 family RNA polymerase sigma factor [Solirubrobacterales bacterium]|nr:sigma-70 family RNA polymerase sigma factor [Solirubrobacterales bacterium]
MQAGVATAGRKRAAVELIAREDPELRQTARRYSLCEEDAEDAYQRALEILLVKAPSDRSRELFHWMKTVVKHEALAIRSNRERMLGVGEDSDDDPVGRLVAAAAGPGERVEQRERVDRTREALQALKPAELRALTLLAAGYSYAEIGRQTGYSQTKVNRCIAEGRERFRSLLTASESGTRCAELGPLLSAYCDGEAVAEDAAAVREHLRACPVCRATMRAYRATPAAVVALAPLLPASRSLLERAQELAIGLQARLPGGGGGAGDGGAASVAAAGGARGAGMAALAKGLAICAGTVGGAAACVATGVAPAPLGLQPEQARPAKVERVAERVVEPQAPAAVEYEPAAESPEPQAQPEEPPSETAPTPAEPAPEATAGAVEYAPPAPEPGPTDAAGPSPQPSAAAGEFGP